MSEGSSLTNAVVVVGFYAGKNNGIKRVEYNRATGTSKDVIIRTNGGDLVVNAQNDSVAHYGTVNSVNVQNISDKGYIENNSASFLKVQSGRVVITENANIGGIHAVKTGDTFVDIKIAVVGDANIPAITRDKVSEDEKTQQGTYTKLVLEIQTVDTAKSVDSNPEYVWISVVVDGEGDATVSTDVATSKTNLDETTKVADNQKTETAKAVEQTTEEAKSVTEAENNATEVLAPTFADNVVARIANKGYEDIYVALSETQNGDKVYILKDINSGTKTTNVGPSGNTRVFAYGITKSITIDGGNHTLTSTAYASNVRAIFGIYGNNIDVKLENLKVVGTRLTRGIETRGGGIKSLTLNNVEITSADSSRTDATAIQIGGNQQAKLDLKLNNCVLNDSKYGIIFFNPVDAEITNTTISGWSCLYLKGANSSYGSKGSEILLKNSTLDSSNPHSGPTNSFGMIAFEDNDITINIEDTELKVANIGDQYQAVATYGDNSFFPNNNETSVVTLKQGTHILLLGQGAVLTVNSAPLTTEEGYELYTLDNNNYYIRKIVA